MSAWLGFIDWGVAWGEDAPLEIVIGRGGDDAGKKRKRHKSSKQKLDELLQTASEARTAIKGVPAAAFSPTPATVSRTLPLDTSAAAIEEDDEEVLLALA